MTDYDHELALAASAVHNASAITNKEERRLIVATQTALALIDIASSLRVLAAAELGVLDAAFEVTMPEPEVEAPEPVDLTDADAGTRVRLVAQPDKLGELTGSGGIDQGIPWVGVLWDDADHGGIARVFVPHLEAVHAPTARAAAPAPEVDAIAALKSKKGKGKK